MNVTTRVTGSVTEFLPNLQAATAAALYRLPLSSDGVIIMWAGMLAVEVKPTYTVPTSSFSLAEESEATHA